MTKSDLRILIVEDSVDDTLLIVHTLSRGGFQVTHKRVDTQNDLMHALISESWDLVISDYIIPGFSGLTALSVFRERNIDIPFFLVSGSIGEEKAVEAMRAGAHDYIMKDNMHRLVPAITRELRDAEERKHKRSTDLQLRETEDHLGRLKRFFSPQIAELALSTMDDPFHWHRKDVTVIFMDLHGFTNFVEISEPEVVITILQEYYAEVGKVVQKYGGTVGHVAGDGIMVFLNDPVDIPDPQEKGVLLALEAREVLVGLTKRWGQLEYPLDFGAGIASGYATIGGVGAEGCWDYSIFGTVTNTASRLCSYATNGQILVSKRFLSPVQELFEHEPIGDLLLKGLNRTVSAYNILGRKVVT